MADRDKRSDVDKLLAEVERTLGGETTGAAKPGRERAPAPRRGGPAARLRAAAVSGAVAAVVVWVAFALLPLLGATSGAAGAFLGVFVAVLMLPRR
jgi:hypothetical protein